MPELQIDRDSVHAGDDFTSHEVSIAVSDSMSIEQLLVVASESCSLPKISGGKATWFAYSEAEPKLYLGVLAQQWEKPKLLPQAATTVGQAFIKPPGKLIFRYWCQADPDLVYDALANNRELPSRYL